MKKGGLPVVNHQIRPFLTQEDTPHEERYDESVVGEAHLNVNESMVGEAHPANTKLLRGAKT